MHQVSIRSNAMIHEPTPEEEALATSIVDKALEGFEHLLPAADLEVLRALLESELVATEDGQRQLRACMTDPVVKRSDEVAAPGVIQIPTADRKKTGR